MSFLPAGSTALPHAQWVKIETSGWAKVAMGCFSIAPGALPEELLPCQTLAGSPTRAACASSSDLRAKPEG